MSTSQNPTSDGCAPRSDGVVWLRKPFEDDSLLGAISRAVGEVRE